jgi:hypothetical protein
VARDFNKLRLPPVDLQKLALDPGLTAALKTALAELPDLSALPPIPEDLRKLGDPDWHPPRPATPDATWRPTMSQIRRELWALVWFRAHAAGGHQRVKPRKQRAVLEIVHALHSDGKLPIKTADIWREVGRNWAPVAAKYGFDLKKPPDVHTVARALDREV